MWSRDIFQIRSLLFCVSQLLVFINGKCKFIVTNEVKLQTSHCKKLKKIFFPLLR